MYICRNIYVRAAAYSLSCHGGAMIYRMLYKTFQSLVERRTESVTLMNHGLWECDCLSVTLVHCGQTVGWIKMALGMEIGLVPGHTVLDGDPAPPRHGNGHSSSHFSAHICFSQTDAHLSYWW